MLPVQFYVLVFYGSRSAGPSPFACCAGARLWCWREGLVPEFRTIHFFFEYFIDVSVNHFVTMSGIAASASAGPAVAPKGGDKMEPRLLGLMQTHGVSEANMDKLGTAGATTISIVKCVDIGRK